MSLASRCSDLTPVICVAQRKTSKSSHCSKSLNLHHRCDVLRFTPRTSHKKPKLSNLLAGFSYRRPQTIYYNVLDKDILVYFRTLRSLSYLTQDNDIGDERQLPAAGRWPVGVLYRAMTSGITPTVAQATNTRRAIKRN